MSSQIRTINTFLSFSQISHFNLLPLLNYNFITSPTSCHHQFYLHNHSIFSYIQLYYPPWVRDTYDSNQIFNFFPLWNENIQVLPMWHPTALRPELVPSGSHQRKQQLVTPWCMVLKLTAPELIARCPTLTEPNLSLSSSSWKPIQSILTLNHLQTVHPY